MTYTSTQWINDSRFGDLHPDALAALNNIESGLSGAVNGGSIASINLKSAYGILAGQDITTALQAAINAIVAGGYAGGEIVIPDPGTYLLNGAPQTGTALTYAYNGQVLFPAVNWSNVPTLPITIKGGVRASSGALSTGQASGVVIQSNANGAYMFDCVPAQSGFGWQWTGIMPIFEDIILRSPAGGTAGGINAKCALRARFNRVEVAVATGVGTQPTGTLQGIVAPHGQNNGDVTFRDVNVRGMFTGIRLSEHCVLDNVEIIACTNAFEAGENFHTNYFGYVDVEECANIFHCPSGSNLLVSGSLDVEAVVADGAWNAPCYLVSPTSVTQPIGALTVNLDGSPNGALALGATAWNLDLANVFASTGDQGGLGGWRVKHPNENFTRLQGLTLTGNPGQCWPTLHPWRLGQGSFSIAANACKSLTASGHAQAYVPVRSAGETRRVSLTTALAASGYFVSLWAHRITAGTNSGKAIEVRVTGGNINLLIAGVSRVVASGVVSGSNTYTVSADVIYGDRGAPILVKVYLGTTLLIAYAPTAAEVSAFIPTGASYPYTEDGIDFFNDTTSSITSFVVTPITAALTTGTATLTALAYSTSMTPDASQSDLVTVTVTDNVAFTVNAPANPPISTQTQDLTVEFLNSSGGAVTNIGLATWNAAFVLTGGALTNPASTKKRFIRFMWNGAKWVELARASADY